MSAAARFSVWWFPSDVGAQRAIHPLARSAGAALQLEDAAVVSWPEERPRPLAWQALDLAGNRPFAGAFWGMLVGLIFLLPLSRAGGDDEMAAPDDRGERAGTDWAHGDLVGLGFDAGFVAAVRDRVTCGSSALFVVDASIDPDTLGRTLPAPAREVVRLALTDDQLLGLHAGFDG